MYQKTTIVLAPDSFKESLSSAQVCIRLKEGIQKENPAINVIVAPIADGGEGTVDAVLNLPDTADFIEEVRGPLGEKVKAKWGMIKNPSGNTAIIEMASASGLPLVPETVRDPLITTTYGLGELILRAVDAGCQHIIIGLGGSATNDGGAGMLQALGFSLLDKNGIPILSGNQGLSRLHTIDDAFVNKSIRSVEFVAASDVQNPLTGENGASFVYGPQKGASDRVVEQMEQNMKHYSDLVKKLTGKDWSNRPGAGAAGGLGFALLAFLNSKLRSGFDIIAELTDLDTKIKSADWVVTGEGKLDSQTLSGKGPYGVAQMAKKYGKPVIAVGGMIDPKAEKHLEKEFDRIYRISPAETSKEDSILNADKYLIETGKKIAVYIINK